VAVKIRNVKGVETEEAAQHALFVPPSPPFVEPKSDRKCGAPSWRCIVMSRNTALFPRYQWRISEIDH
jgi:hypothetical protein